MGSQGRKKRLVPSEGESVLPLEISIESLKRARALGADLLDLGFGIDYSGRLRSVSISATAPHYLLGQKK